MFNIKKKHYCGTYKGVDVWQYGSMIGNNWYGDFYITQKKGKTQRNYKVRGSIHRSAKELMKWIDDEWLEYTDMEIVEL